MNVRNKKVNKVSVNRNLAAHASGMAERANRAAAKVPDCWERKRFFVIR